jgi:hypothetical protein
MHISILKFNSENLLKLGTGSAPVPTGVKEGE